MAKINANFFKQSTCYLNSAKYYKNKVFVEKHCSFTKIIITFAARYVMFGINT
jgi:hypothetical protein